MPINGNIIISIDGNIGSGKSTILKNIKNKYSGAKTIIMVDEPVHIWETIVDENGKNVLTNFYENQNEYSFTFQIIALSSRIALIKKACSENHGCIIVTERNLQTDRYVFAQMLFDSGKISTINFNVYKHMYDTFVNDYKSEKVIHVNTSPEVCYKRVGERQRSGEENIPLSYLQECGDYHDKLISMYSDKRVLTIEGNNNMNDVPEYFNSVYMEINDFVNGEEWHVKNDTM
jgi:deoxyadenosine/deoxycytidine kinase